MLLDLSRDQYDELKLVNYSALKWMAVSAARYKYELERTREPSPAMALGTAVHCAILEPFKFEANYAKMPKFDRRTNVGKCLAAEWESENKSKIGLCSSDWDTVMRCRDSVLNDRTYADLLKDGVAEHAAVTDENKGLIDFYSASNNIVVDIKTTTDASSYSFGKSIRTYGYWVQAAMYMDLVEDCMGVRPDKFIILAIEKNGLCDVKAYEIGAKTLYLGSDVWKGWMNTLKRCWSTGRYEGYDRHVERYDVPDFVSENLFGE